MFNRVLLLLKRVAKKHKITIDTDDSASILILLANAYELAEKLQNSGVVFEIKGRPAVLDSIERAYVEMSHIRKTLPNIDTSKLSPHGVIVDEDKI